MSTNTTLQLFHVSDQEAKAASVDDAPRFSAMYNFLASQDVDEDGTLFLASGDQWLPGLFYDASAQEDPDTGTSLYGLEGAADILIQNELRIQVSAFGNHEFDNGNAIIADLLQPVPEGYGGILPFEGANFPYISGNADFSANVDVTDEDGDVTRGLQPLVTENGQVASDIPGGVAEYVIVEDENGNQYGVVGVSAADIDEGLSSPTNTDIQPDGEGAAGDMEALAPLVQEDIDALLADNPDIDKVILLGHLQVLDRELELATLLTDVDIVIGGGSNRRLFDEDDVGFGGEQAQGDYPTFTTDADGNPVAVVNTDQNYKYVGRLVLEFDENGYIIPDSYDQTISGAYATDQANLDRLGVDFETWADPEIIAITDGIRDVIAAGESEFYAITTEFLNANRFGGGEGRDGVRSQETNLANLTGDANLAYAKGFDDTVTVSVKNGGGIRASIGIETVPGGGSDPVRLPPEEVPGVKPEGGISSNDVTGVLAFNNGLILLTVTTAELVSIIEGGISNFVNVDTEAGGFLHFAGVRFSFDPDAPAGSRVLNAAIVDEETLDEEGQPLILAELVRDGQIVDASATHRIVTLDFLAREGNEFDMIGTDRVDLNTLEPGETFNTVDSFDAGSEQDALAEYLNVTFGPDGERTLDDPDTPQEFDERIQNVNVREDTVFGESDGGETPPGPGPEPVDPPANTVASVEFLGHASLPSGFGFQGTTLGGLSSLQWDPVTGHYYAISDDQANYRYYTLGIDLSDGTLSDGDVTATSVRFLTDAEGHPLAHGSIDPEELTLIGDGTYFVTNEGFANGDTFENPSVLVFDSETDRQIGEIPFDAKFDADPAGESGIANNAATEAGTITPGGETFYSGFENALIQDGPLASPETGSPSRIVEWDLTTGEAVAEYVYQNYPNPAQPDPEDAFQVNGITALLSLDDAGTLLALERNFAVGDEQTGTGHGGFLYEIGTHGATNVIDEESLDGLSYASVDKRFLLDLSTLTDAEGNPVVVDNVEGLTFGPELEDGRQTLLIVSDDNFSDSQSTQVMAFAVELEEVEPAPKPDLKFAAYNTMLSSPADVEDGGAGDLEAPGNNPDGTARDNLFNRLNGGQYEVAQNLAYVVQTERPDVMLVNEIDFDEIELGNTTLSSAQVLNDQYFAVGQFGQSGIDYPYVYTFSSNTGVPTGFDVNNDGIVGEIDPDTGLIGGFAASEEEAVALRAATEPRDQAPSVFQDLEGGFVKQPNDAFGFGRYEGQYAMAIYSMYPILEDELRTFQEFLWKDMPGNKLTETAPGIRPLYDPARPFDPNDPENPDTSFFSQEEFEVLRLSSKNHVDIPVDVNGQTVNILASHPTPATYSLSPGQNEGRNFDEIRFWADYINGESYMYDDDGEFGGLEPGATFIIAGDLNADPFDGAALPGAASQLIDDPLVIGSATDASITPASLGGIEDDDSDGTQIGNPAFDTVDYSLSEPGRGNVRVDYALPSSSGFEYVDGEVIWPLDADPLSGFVDYPTSDHKMVTVELNFTTPILLGTPGNETLVGSDADERFDPQGGVDTVTTGGGMDEILFTDIVGVRDVITLTDFDPAFDMVDLGGATIASQTVLETETRVILEGADVDTLVFRGLSEAPFDTIA